MGAMFIQAPMPLVPKGRDVGGVIVDDGMGSSGGPANAREMRADWIETGPKLDADLRALNPRGGSKTAILEQHEGVLRAHKCLSIRCLRIRVPSASLGEGPWLAKGLLLFAAGALREDLLGPRVGANASRAGPGILGAPLRATALQSCAHLRLYKVRRSH